MPAARLVPVTSRAGSIMRHLSILKAHVISNGIKQRIRLLFNYQSDKVVRVTALRVYLV